MKRLPVIILALLLALTACVPAVSPPPSASAPTPGASEPAPSASELTPADPEPTPVVPEPAVNPELYTRDIHTPAHNAPDPIGSPGTTEQTYIFKPKKPMTLDEIAYGLGEIWLNSMMGDDAGRTFAITEWRNLKPVIYDGPLLYYRMQKNDLLLTPGQYLVNFSAEYRYTGALGIDRMEPDTIHKSPDGFTTQIWPSQGSGEANMFLMEQTGKDEYTLRTLNSCSRSALEGAYKQYLDEAREWLKNLSDDEKAVIAKYMPTDRLVVSAVNLNPPYLDGTAFLVSKEPGWERESFIVYRRPMEGGGNDFFAPSLFHSENADNCVAIFISYVYRGDFEGWARLHYEGTEPEPEVLEQWRRAFGYYAGAYDLTSFTIDSAHFAWGPYVLFPGYFYNLKDADGKPFILELEYGDGLVWIHPYTGS